MTGRRRRCRRRAPRTSRPLRQGTVESIPSLLKGTDTPDEPYLNSSTVCPTASTSSSARGPNGAEHHQAVIHQHLRPFIDNMITEQNRKAAVEARNGQGTGSRWTRAGEMPLKRRKPAPPDFSAVPIDYPPSRPRQSAPGGSTAPARPGPLLGPATPLTTRIRWRGGRRFIDGPTPPTNRVPPGIAWDRASPVMMRGEETVRTRCRRRRRRSGASPCRRPPSRRSRAGLAKVDKPKAKNPKARPPQDHREVHHRDPASGRVQRFHRARRLGYRKAFDRFLVETTRHAHGGWVLVRERRAEPFFRVLFHIATDGRVQLDPDAVNALFCKREKRQAAEWLLDEEELSKLGVTATGAARSEGRADASRVSARNPAGNSHGCRAGRRRGAREDARVVIGGGCAAAAAAAAAAAQHQHHPQHSK